jgi:hypothetical protein
MKTPLSKFDVIFISYDEDNADKNWADLLNKVPWAKRVHGVEGSDSAHKAAARESTTERFISVDADNIVDAEFFDQEIDLEHPKFKDKVISWSAINQINGLQYGNGGLKCWPVEYVMNMKTHENADDDLNQIDFCWEDSYVQMNNIYCKTYPNGSARQAFRAGFREGVKMSLDRGQRVPIDEFENRIWWGNLHRLLVWCSVGNDVEWGEWAIYGARLGCQMTTLTDWNYVNVRDFTWLNDFWNNSVLDDPDELLNNIAALRHRILMLGKELRDSLSLPIAELDYHGSVFFKKAYVGLPRTGAYLTEAEMNDLRALNK